MIAIFFGSFISTLIVSTINIAIPVLTEHFNSNLAYFIATLIVVVAPICLFIPKIRRIEEAQKERGIRADGQ
jgi:MFS family permease